MKKCLDLALLRGRGWFKSHPVHFFLLWNRGIRLSSFLADVGQNPAGMLMPRISQVLHVQTLYLDKVYSQ
jgi:hypothetical protein